MPGLLLLEQIEISGERQTAALPRADPDDARQAAE